MKSWDIFCRVIDNYGDIGVCWRLARQLANEHQQQVRLWVDDMSSLIRIWPDTLELNQQHVAGVEVCHWSPEFAAQPQVADRVIEAFACKIPATYVNAMAIRKKEGEPPIWINLDYLSAESWIEDCHRMPSTHPNTGLRKTFFFPGFTPRTGGLLREQSLVSTRDNFQSAPWLDTMGVKPQPDALLVSLFAYENPAISTLLDAWANSTRAVHCLIPNGKILTSINQAIGQELNIGDLHQQGNLCLQVIPFVTQTEYDQLLWSCDINFVRGEDSFVRAQWAGKPMLWHIYPQDEDTHITKLKAFLDIYTRQAPVMLQTALHESWLAWNQNGDMRTSWQQLLPLLNDWQQYSHTWCDYLLAQTDLSTQIVAFCDNQQG
jgi:uncharacterized repeat protein (TIGR03837 family)